MRLIRIPQRVANCLYPLSSSLNCPQGQHFRLFCWLLVSLIVCQGSATLRALNGLMPRSLRYWTVLRLVRAGYWDASALITSLSRTVLYCLPPQKTGQRQPLARKTRTNCFAPYLCGQSLVLLIAQWGRFRVPVAAAVIDPKVKGHQNLLFRQMLAEFVPPSWAAEVVVEADAAFAAKATLSLITDKGYNYVFGLARTWKLADGTRLAQLARHTPKSCYHRFASYKPDGRRKDYWVFRRRARVAHLGDVTILLSKSRRNYGPQRIKLIVTNLTEATTGEILSHYHRRWGVEVAFKELKSGLHLGQMQVTKRAERVVHALLLPILAYLLLLRLYGLGLKPETGASIWQLKQRFLEEVYQEQQDRTKHKWRKKLDQLRAAA
jgi:Transposase DDE domain